MDDVEDEPESVPHEEPPSVESHESSSDSDDSEDDLLAEVSDFHLSISDRIKLLLLLATKRRHNLSYSGAEDIMELAGVLAEEDKPFLPTRHLMKMAIQMYSCALTEHHVCPNCDKYIGVVTSATFQCPSCTEQFSTSDNKKKGFCFLYLSLHDQLKALLESCYDSILKTMDKQKIIETNFEDIYDGKLYKVIMRHDGYISFNFFVDGLQVRNIYILFF